jgi:hypothetical protein
MAAATAAVTSMPGVVAPVVAARIELISTDGVEELTIEDVLILSYLLSGKTPSRTFKAFTNILAWGSEGFSMRNDGEVEPRGAHLSFCVDCGLGY